MLQVQPLPCNIVKHKYTTICIYCIDCNFVIQMEWILKMERRGKIPSFSYHMRIASRLDGEKAKGVWFMIAGFSSAHEFLGSPESVMGFMCKKDRKVAPRIMSMRKLNPTNSWIYSFGVFLCVVHSQNKRKKAFIWNIHFRNLTIKLVLCVFSRTCWFSSGVLNYLGRPFISISKIYEYY